MFRGVRADINIDFFHHLDGHGVHVTGRLGTGTGHVDSPSSRGTKDALGQVTAATVAGAKDKDGWRFHLPVNIIYSTFSPKTRTDAVPGFGGGCRCGQNLMEYSGIGRSCSLPAKAGRDPRNVPCQ